MSTTVFINPSRFTVAGGSFAPDDVAGLVRWYKADGETTYSDDDEVTSLTDFSPANVDGTTPSVVGPKWRTNVLNGLPVFRFDGIDDTFDIGNLSALTAGEAFVVIKLDSATPTAPTQGLWTIGSGGLSTVYPYDGDGIIYDDFGTDTRKATADPATNLSTWFIYSVYSATNMWRNFINGTGLIAEITSNTVAFNSTALLGKSNTAVYWVDGDIAEFILYDNKLSGGDRTSVISYLQAKYAI